jgi:arsenate reductase
MTASPARLLVLCSSNGCLSQMAEGYLRRFCGATAEVYSAGMEPLGVDLNAVRVMREDGVDIAHHTTNHLHEYSGLRFDHLIVLCDRVRDKFTLQPLSAALHHYDLPDPARAELPPDDLLHTFRAARDQVKAYCATFARLLAHAPA